MSASLLFIVPSPGMAEIAAQASRSMGLQDQMIIQIGKDAAARDIALRYPEATVLISRGGTADDLKVLGGRSVIEVKITANEILQAVQNITGKTDIRQIGIVSLASLFADDGARDFSLGEIKICFRPCKDVKEIKTTVDFLCQERVQAIIGCKFANQFARDNGVCAEFIESSATSVKKAIQEAVKILRAREDERLQTVQMRTVLDTVEEGIVAIADNGQIALCNRPAKRLLMEGSQAMDHQQIQRMLQFPNEDKMMTVNGNKILARVTPLRVQDIHKGNVITIREVSTIQDAERKVRMSTYTKGFYAKKTFADILTVDAAMKKMIQKAQKYARLSANILIYGETGVGKDVFAQSIHQESGRRNGPFVAVNCAAIPHSLLESELFGYVAGAFTGARKEGKKGLFEMADGGTLFLDEIGEMPLEIQSRLLRVLEEKAILRIGDDKMIPINIRVICATNRDLLALARQGLFRLDLYYRIHVFVLPIPPLRQRPEDIPLLFARYLQAFLAEPRQSMQVSPGAIQKMQRYPWRGNIRELINAAEVLATGDQKTIDERQLDEVLSREDTDEESLRWIQLPDTLSLKEMENEIIGQLLSRYSLQEACKKLGISRATLWRKINRYQK